MNTQKKQWKQQVGHQNNIDLFQTFYLWLDLYSGWLCLDLSYGWWLCLDLSYGGWHDLDLFSYFASAWALRLSVFAFIEQEFCVRGVFALLLHVFLNEEQVVCPQRISAEKWDLMLFLPVCSLHHLAPLWEEQPPSEWGQASPAWLGVSRCCGNFALASLLFVLTNDWEGRSVWYVYGLREAVSSGMRSKKRQKRNIKLM